MGISQKHTVCVRDTDKTVFCRETNDGKRRSEKGWSEKRHFAVLSASRWKIALEKSIND